MEFLAQYHPAWLFGLALALLATGIIAGVMAGLLGVGGGIVIVPVLYHLFTLLDIDPAVRMHLAVGTSLATIVPLTMKTAPLGAKLAHRINPRWLRLAFAGFLALTAARMFFDLLGSSS